MKKTKSPLTRVLELVRLEKSEIWSIYFYAILNGLILLSVPLGIQSIVGFVMGASFRASIYVLIFLVVAAVLASGLMQINQRMKFTKIYRGLTATASLKPIGAFISFSNSKKSTVA